MLAWQLTETHSSPVLGSPALGWVWLGCTARPGCLGVGSRTCADRQVGCLGLLRAGCCSRGTLAGFADQAAGLCWCGGAALLLQVLQEAEDGGVYLETPVWNALLMCAGGAAVQR